MRSKSVKFRTFTWKRRKIIQKHDIPTNYNEPTPTLQNAAYKMILTNIIK